MSGTTVSADGRLRFDGLETLLASVLDATSSYIFFESTLTHSGGVEVQTIPSIPAATGEHVALAILDQNNKLAEIVHLTEYTQGTTTGFVVRGQEGTTPRSHAQGAKVVHAATIEDYLNVQDHENDPQAHSGAFTGLASSIMQGHLEAHEQNPNADPHPVYIRKSDSTIETLEVTDTLVVRPNAQLVVQGDLVIEGRLILHGYELFIGPTRPPQMSDSTIWIQTVS